MREIVIDTETTGLKPGDGHRIVEIGAVEISNLISTGRVFHCYLNPERDVPQEAFRVHGLSTAFLSQHKTFAEIATGFLQFVEDANLVAHNAEFDMAFLNFELARLGLPEIAMARVIDTLALARRRHPGAANSLDALCARYGIDASRRDKHGALLDAGLLAEVYAELMGGRQAALSLQSDGAGVLRAMGELLTRRPTALPARLSAQEEEAHRNFVAGLGKEALWTRYLEVE